MRTHLKLKAVDDVLGGQKAWENVDKTTSKLRHVLGPARAPQLILPVTCGKCDHTHAYFRQLQIRSADEPMTTF